MVKIVRSAYEGIIKHAESGYPNEVCGVLIGKDEEITNFKECRNLNQERARDRYELDDRSFNEADNWARSNGMDILGIYHSHPDHASEYSEFDRQRAWPYWIYMIFSINSGKYNDARAWILKDFGSHFEEEKIELISD
ncbi:MAG: M67 family metallopeptidase [Deltaproteobacteria bacterium]|nr:M67 family metallopeptidase [Deltaproteobacteria bacterium]